MADAVADEAEEILARYATFRRMGFDELDAQALARNDVQLAEVNALLTQKCPIGLIARILT